MMRIARVAYVWGAILSLTLFAAAQAPDNVVLWSARLASERPLKAGQKVAAVLDASIEPGWHVYAITQPPGGPTRTQISVPMGQVVKLAGNITGPKPQSAYDSTFSMQVESYEEAVSFRVPLAVSADAKPGAIESTLDVRFQACSDRLCLPPATKHVPLNVTIAGGK